MRRSVPSPCCVPKLESHQFVSVLFHVPDPPRFAPLEALLPAIEPSVSQKRGPACTERPNSASAVMAMPTRAMLTNASLLLFQLAVCVFKERLLSFTPNSFKLKRRSLAGERNSI